MQSGFGTTTGVHSRENCNFWTGGFEQYRGKNWYKQRELAKKEIIILAKYAEKP